MTEPGWISLKCSWCQTKFRIKEAYAHLKGKCPECGTRVLPVKHKPHQPLPAFSDAHEPVGLVPLDDEEWPEPAQRELDHGEVAGLHYGFPAVTPASGTPAPTPPAPGTVFTLASEKPVAPPPVPTNQGTEDTFQPAPPRKEKPPPAPPPKKETPPPPVKPPPPKAEVDPLFLDDMPAMAAALPPPPAPPAPSLPPTLPVETAAVAPADPYTLADVQKAQQPPDDPHVISPYSFRDGAPPAPPPLAKFPPPDYVPPADGEKDAKPKRKKEKPAATTDKSDPQASSDAPSKDQDSYRLSRAELNPERAVPPPDQLFIFGVWDWPFHPVNLKALLATAFGAMLFLFFLAQSIDQYTGTGPSSALGFVFGSALAFLALVIFGIFGSYASAWFLAILNDTANGCRDVTFPGGGIVEWLGVLLRVVWIAFLSGLITIPLGAIWWPLWGLGALMLFPVFLLCSLASDWSLSPWHPDVAWNIVRKLKLYFTMNFLAALLWSLVATVIWATATSKWLLCPLGGVAFGIVWLIYARLMGRFGWVVLNPDEEPERKKKKKKKKKKADGDSSEEESPPPDDTTGSLVAAEKS